MEEFIIPSSNRTEVSLGVTKSKTKMSLSKPSSQGLGIYAEEDAENL